MTAKAEQKLAKRISEGDSKAMKTLYDEYAGYLMAVCSRYIDSKEDIKDLMQESFIRIFSGIRSFEYRGEGSLKAWMSRIVANTSLKYLKEMSLRGTISLEENLPSIRDYAEDDMPEISGIPPDVIHNMIRKLPPGYRTVFNLYVFENMSHKEIAETLGIKEDSSASQLHRAKSLLANWIKEYRKRN